MKKIISVGFDIPGYSENYYSYTSSQSLLDADIIIFEPDFLATVATKPIKASLVIVKMNLSASKRIQHIGIQKFQLHFKKVKPLLFFCTNMKNILFTQDRQNTLEQVEVRG